MKSDKVFSLIVIGVALVFLVLSVYDLFKWNQIRTSPTETSPISRSEASVSFILALLLAILSVVLIGAAAYFLLRPTKKTVVAASITERKATPTTTIIEESRGVVPLYELQKPTVLYTKVQ
jgi:ABC-type Fe3+ transport system permease subunit